MTVNSGFPWIQCRADEQLAWRLSNLCSFLFLFDRQHPFTIKECCFREAIVFTSSPIFTASSALRPDRTVLSVRDSPSPSQLSSSLNRHLAPLVIGAGFHHPWPCLLQKKNMNVSKTAIHLFTEGQVGPSLVKDKNLPANLASGWNSDVIPQCRQADAKPPICSKQ